MLHIGIKQIQKNQRFVCVGLLEDEGLNELQLLLLSLDLLEVSLQDVGPLLELLLEHCHSLVH